MRLTSAKKWAEAMRGLGRTLVTGPRSHGHELGWAGEVS